MWVQNAIESEDAYNKAREMISDNMISNAETLEELDSAIAQSELSGAAVTQQEKSDALVNLASSYDNCTEAMERYQRVLNSGNEAEIKSAEAVLRSSIRIGEAAKKYGLNADSLEA
jgi:hypothetical protein